MHVDMFTNNWCSSDTFSDLKNGKREAFPIRPAGLQVRDDPLSAGCRRSSSQIYSDLCDINKYHLYILENRL